ncbi:MAG: tRNA (N6-threonylcarbamoyladenosine(37)-N6)-methyltransferase TrmO [Chlamydiales bacterium]|nr:tRNA (N6-threonylcarbamoyladenosine(37)-N6)-methyltransferase TrmO [Chlamydiales bacterium]
MFSIEPIATFITKEKERYEAPRQPLSTCNSQGTIRLLPHRNYEQAIEDLNGFDRIWVIFWLHLNQNWKPKVRPPRGDRKRGTFATRSPHRPNPIGLSCVELLDVNGLDLIIGSHDLLDGTPILDIKPYLPYCDAFPNAKAGWTNALQEQHPLAVSWSEAAESQLNFLATQDGPDIRSSVACRLSYPRDHQSCNRIRTLEGNLHELSYKSWRIIFTMTAAETTVLSISTGYSSEELLSPEDRWGDKELHRRFVKENFY